MSVSAGDDINLDSKDREDSDKLAEFLCRIDAGDLIERDDWMPRDYCEGMLRMAEHHGNSEIMGALPEGEWITRAPNLHRKLALIAKVQDEVGHGQMLYRVVEDLGKPRDEILRDLIAGRTKYHNVFNYPVPSWADVCMIAWLVDGAAIMNQKTLAEGSYGPYVRTMKRINMEEAFHFKHGEDMVLTMMSGTPRQKQMGQEAFNRWWPPSVMFFGPPDKQSTQGEKFLRYRLKISKNNDLRHRFVDRFAPAARALGLHFPEGDEHYYFDADTGHWRFPEPDWDEFYRVIRGHGPCNERRLALRRFSYERGQWVRKAIIGSAGVSAA